MPRVRYHTEVEKKAKAKSSPKKAKKPGGATGRWEPKGYDKIGLRDELNPKPKFVVSDVADPVRKKRKAKAKDPKRALKAGEMRSTPSQRKSTQKALAKRRRGRRLSKR